MCIYSGRQKYKRTVSASLAQTELGWRITVSCAAVYASIAETQPIRGQSASITPTAQASVQLPVLGFATDVTTPRRGLFIVE
jgi:hypothetical protein